MKYDDALEMLSSGIVRAVFITRDKRHREIYATRNSRIVSQMTGRAFIVPENVDSYDKLNGFISVYDMQKMDFRKINLATIVDNTFEKFVEKVPPLSDNISAIPTNGFSTREDTVAAAMKVLQGKDIDLDDGFNENAATKEIEYSF